MVILSSFVIATRRSASEEKCEDNIRRSEAGWDSVRRCSDTYNTKQGDRHRTGGSQAPNRCSIRCCRGFPCT